MARRNRKKEPPPTAVELLARLGDMPAEVSQRPAWIRRRDELKRLVDQERRSAERARVRQMPDAYRVVAVEQERHDPTVPLTVRDDVRVNQKTGKPEAREIGITVQRGSQARLLSSLDRWQSQAFHDIGAIAEIIFPAAPRVRAQSYERRDPGHDAGIESETRIDNERLYFRWANLLMRRGIKHAWVWLIIVDGDTLEMVEEKRRSDKRTVKRHLCAALDLWCIERGWIKTETEVLASFQPKAGARTLYEALR